ncbi:hypothetical protein V492_07347 [Pseudogymnoascus sp. VKM F-4246]|nr:hypothetical protein V492_07347 [Pseudogymnoascus sp. VKM F-4246]
MATFNDLPFEIRALIWGFTVEPRTVEVRAPWKKEIRDVLLISKTPVPAPLQTCREARNQGLYKQAFSEVGAEPRYVWLNLDIDLISIGKSALESFEPVGPSIRRIKLQRTNPEDWWNHGEAQEISTFVKAEEIHIVCEDGLSCWRFATEYHSWPCEENVFLIDPEDGRMVRSLDLDKMIADEEHAEYMQGVHAELPTMDDLDD